MSLAFITLAIVTLVFLPTSAHAYVDPGLVSMVLQGLFVAVAGFVAVYIVGPWRWLKSLFGKTKPITQGNEAGAETKPSSHGDKAITAAEEDKT